MNVKDFTRRAFLAGTGSVVGMLATAGTGILLVPRAASAEFRPRASSQLVLREC